MKIKVWKRERKSVYYKKFPLCASSIYRFCHIKTYIPYGFHTVTVSNSYGVSLNSLDHSPGKPQAFSIKNIPAIHSCHVSFPLPAPHPNLFFVNQLFIESIHLFRSRPTGRLPIHTPSYILLGLTGNSRTGKSRRLFQFIISLIRVKNGTQTNLTLYNLT